MSTIDVNVDYESVEWFPKELDADGFYVGKIDKPKKKSNWKRDLLWLGVFEILWYTYDYITHGYWYPFQRVVELTGEING